MKEIYEKKLDKKELQNKLKLKKSFVSNIKSEINTISSDDIRNSFNKGFNFYNSKYLKNTGIKSANLENSLSKNQRFSYFENIEAKSTNLENLKFKNQRFSHSENIKTKSTTLENLRLEGPIRLGPKNIDLYNTHKVLKTINCENIRKVCKAKEKSKKADLSSNESYKWFAPKIDSSDNWYSKFKAFDLSKLPLSGKQGEYINNNSDTSKLPVSGKQGEYIKNNLDNSQYEDNYNSLLAGDSPENF